MVTEQVEYVPIVNVKPAEDNPRKKIGDVAELAMSIKSSGVQQPLLGRRVNGHVELVAGARRLAAAELAGLDVVPVIVREYSEEERIVAMAIENLQREDLAVLDEAHAYQRLLDDLKISQRELAQRVGKTQSHISKRLALLALPKNVRADVDSGGITIEDALLLVKLADQPERVQAVVKGRTTWISIEQLVARELRELEKEAAIAKAEAEIESKGMRSVRVPQEYQMPKGITRLKGGSPYYASEALQIMASKHETEECHAIAIAVGHHQLLRFPVCTNRKNHPGVKTKAEADRAKSAGSGSSGFKAPREDPTTKKLREATERRHALVSRLAAKKPPKEAAQLVMLRLLENELLENELLFGEIDHDRVAEWLGIIPPLAEDEERDPSLDLPELIWGVAREGDAQLQRAAFAVAVAAIDGDEYAIDHYVRNGSTNYTKLGADYLLFLRSQGDELSDLEQKRLDADTARSAKAA